MNAVHWPTETTLERVMVDMRSRTGGQQAYATIQLSDMDILRQWMRLGSLRVSQETLLYGPWA